ncbi:MAG: HAD-IB family hydrolase [Verrucomicrobiota bacterium]
MNTPLEKEIAFFDLDHTVLPYDTQALFAHFVMQRYPLRRLYLFIYLPSLLLFAIKLISLKTMKRVFSCYLYRMPAYQLNELAKEFAETIVPLVAYPDVVAEIKRHRKEGRTLILNSASPEFYLQHISAHFGFDHYIGTNMVIEKSMPLIPRLIGPNNKKAEKITAMQKRELLPEEFESPLAGCWSYSDSSADIPLLSIAEHGVTIHPKKHLLSAAKQHGWAVTHPVQPYSGKWGGRLASLKQALGIGKFW